MLMEVKNNLRFFIQAIIINLKSVMVYKVNFLVESIFMFINNSTFLVFWYTVFRLGGDNINGVTFNLTLYLWAFSTISYGVTYFFFGGVRYINKYIVDCNLDSFLLQPKSVIINMITSKCNFSAIGDIVYGIIIGLFACKFDILKFAIILFFGVYGSIFFVSTEIIFRSISVWIGDTENIASRYSHTLLTNLSTYPEQIYNSFVKVLIYTVVPVGYFVYLPIDIINSFSIKNVVIIIVVGLAYLFLSVKLFYKALKSYNSGNVISNKI